MLIPRATLPLVLLCLICGPALAAPLPHPINGHVRYYGEGVEDVRVTATNLDTDKSRSTTTGSDGYFQINNGGDFNVNDGDRVKVSFTINDDHYEKTKEVDTDDTATTFEFEVDELPEEEEAKSSILPVAFLLLLITFSVIGFIYRDKIAEVFDR
jgi:hypothetical protein